jgi:serine/threonine protein kinase
VATIYDIGDAGGMHFIVMEYVEGQTLAAKINGQPLAISETVEIVCQIADALNEAHEKGITHRDIKPANVMLTPRGQVKVLDFGLAKISRLSAPSGGSEINALTETAPGVVMGTVPYMSPEQALGREVDYRSDLFSLGAVLYEMVTGDCHLLDQARVNFWTESCTRSRKRWCGSMTTSLHTLSGSCKSVWRRTQSGAINQRVNYWLI